MKGMGRKEGMVGLANGTSRTPGMLLGQAESKQAAS